MTDNKTPDTNEPLQATDSYRQRKTQWYGYIPDLPDHRDWYFTVSQPVADLPKSVDLRANCPQIFNQLNLGACTANALAALYQYNQIKQKNATNWIPSRLFIYYNERWLENSVRTDSGATLRDGIRALAKWGVCPETEWPYVVKQFATKPSDQAYTDARVGVVSKYERIVQQLPDMRTCLSLGKPFVIGIMVYESFESDEVAKTGVVPMPKQSEESLGGHAVLVVGYDDDKQAFLVRNSWGPKWGINGYFWLPYEYVTSKDLTGDLWTIDMVP